MRVFWTIGVPAIEKVFPVDRRDYVKFPEQGSLLPSLIPDYIADLEGYSGWRGGGCGSLTFFRTGVEDGVLAWERGEFRAKGLVGGGDVGDGGRTCGRGGLRVG